MVEKSLETVMRSSGAPEWGSLTMPISKLESLIQ
jgi:hypothetical protein